jgi:hypothetical protein
VIGYEYIVRQTKLLLRMARLADDPKVSAALVTKAADLAERAGVGPPLAPTASDDPAQSEEQPTQSTSSDLRDQ